MTSLLLDASVLLAAEDGSDNEHTPAERLLSCGARLTTLDLAFYEVANVSIRSWADHDAAVRLTQFVSAIADDGGLARADPTLLTHATMLATSHGISVYDAAYVAAADRMGATLVSCDVRDLVSRGLARLPSTALADAE